MSTTYDILIIGGGPSGLTSAIYTSRASLKTLCISGNPSGGQLMWTTEVENFPGFPTGIMGPDLINNMTLQAKRFGTDFAQENVIKIEGSYDTGFKVITDSNAVYSGKAIILASGASAKWLNLESEQKLRGKGVSACATCDGFFFKDKVVAIVGGGDSSMEEALYLARFSSKIYLLVMTSEAELFASKYMYQKAKNEPKIEFLFNTEVRQVLGEEKVEGLKIFSNISNQEKTLPDVKGVFIAIGYKPNTEFLKGFVELEKGDYIKVIDGTKTSKDGVFVCGDVSDHKYKQAITAAGSGCMAAIDAEKFLALRG